MTRNLALIPARGGSKRIPRKNIRPFLGKPMLRYPLRAAQESGLFEEIMVSTDDGEIAGMALAAGASVPFLRSPEQSGDHAGIAGVISEVRSGYQRLGKRFDWICLIYPCTPLLTADLLRRSHARLVECGKDRLFAVRAFDYPVWRGVSLDQEGGLSMVWPEHYSARSQDLPQVYHDAGQFFWIRAQDPLTPPLLGGSAAGMVLGEMEAQDIDTFQDWEVAEFKYRYRESWNGR